MEKQDLYDKLMMDAESVRAKNEAIIAISQGDLEFDTAIVVLALEANATFEDIIENIKKMSSLAGVNSSPDK